MTIIEFLDSVSIHNALSTLLLCPQKLVLLGTNSMDLYVAKNRIQKIIASQNLSTRVHVMPVRIHSYDALMHALETVIATYTDCVFDLTGGPTEMLVAMGALSQKHGIPMHTVDPARGTYTVLTGTFPYPPARSLRLSISENIALYGGKVTSGFVPPSSQSFWQDVLRVWSVCRADCALWNMALGAFHMFVRPEDTSVSLSLAHVTEKLSPKKQDALLRTIRALHKAGVFIDYRENAATISFRYKNHAVQYALSKEGNALELYTYYAAYVVKNRGHIFTAGEIGVIMDWESRPPSYAREDVLNEIDVFLMQGHIPVFISCKNGFVDADELYKLSVVADRFGGPYAKKMIVLTKHRPDFSFLNRAKELSIGVIQNAHALSPAILGERIMNNTVK